MTFSVGKFMKNTSTFHAKSNRQRFSVRKLSKIHRKYLCSSLFSNKFAGLRPLLLIFIPT